jgi:hypothetical protein
MPSRPARRWSSRSRVKSRATGPFGRAALACDRRSPGCIMALPPIHHAALPDPSWRSRRSITALPPIHHGAPPDPSWLSRRSITPLSRIHHGAPADPSRRSAGSMKALPVIHHVSFPDPSCLFPRSMSLLDGPSSHDRTRGCPGAMSMKPGEVGMILHGRIHEGSWMHGNGLMGTCMKAHGCTGAVVPRPPEARGCCSGLRLSAHEGSSLQP